MPSDTIKFLKEAARCRSTNDNPGCVALLISVANAAASAKELRDGRMKFILPKLKQLAVLVVEWVWAGTMEPSDRNLLQVKIQNCFEVIAASLGDTQAWEW